MILYLTILNLVMMKMMRCVNLDVILDVDYKIIPLVPKLEDAFGSAFVISIIWHLVIDIFPEALILRFGKHSVVKMI